jgi:Flp pilus assembly protein TadG
MGMQYDVKSQYAITSGLVLPFRTRVKAFLFGAATTSAGTVGLYDNFAIAGTYARTTTVATITAAKHGLTVGDWAFIDWSGGTNPADDFYQVVTVTNQNTFTVAVANTGDASGVATVYNDVLVISTVSTGNDVFNIIPGEGILAQNGVRVFLENSVPLTVYYG